MASIMITGGTGFIGSYIAKRLLEEGHTVICFDNRLDHSRRLFIGEKAIFHEGDTTSLEEVIAALRKYNVQRVVSLAYLMPLEAEKNLDLAVRVNVLGVNNVFEAARQCGIRRVLYSSSISAYGHVSWYGDRPAREIPEDFHPANNVYGAGKQFNEFMAGRYNQYHGMEIVCIRVSIVFGYGRVRGSTLWIDDMVTNPVRGRVSHVPRRSDQKVSLIYVRDLAEIFCKGVTAPRIHYPVYNSGRHTVSLRGFTEIVRKHVPNATFTFDEEAEPFYLVHAVDDSRIREEFGLKCPSLEENILDQMNMVREMEG